MAAALAGGCAHIPPGRYGVARVAFEGVEQVDAESIRACLGTRERSRITLDIGTRGTPACGQPPFDGRHLILDPVFGIRTSWPWESWPLFDERVYERDVDRIERWYRARGYYNARAEAEVEPDAALRAAAPGEACGDQQGNCEVHVTFRVEEGEPVLIQRMSLRGLDDLPDAIRRSLRDTLPFARGENFDETLFENAKTDMVRVLAEAGYARARVQAEVKVSASRREAFIVFEVKHGLPSLIGEVCVVGYGPLPPRRMLDIANLEAGEPFRVSTLTSAQLALYAIGAFSGVEIGAAPREGYAANADPVCQSGPAEVPDGFEAVPVRIRVSPGRIDRWGFGAGLQAGQTVTFGTITNFADQRAAAQWDFHFSGSYEGRNWFNNLVRTRVEVRPRLIFDMPLFNFTPARDPPLGIQAVGSMRWPSFFEARTNLLIQLQNDLGPMPFTGFFRNELTGLLGPERTFADGIVYAGLFGRFAWFAAADRQPQEPRDALPSSGALWLEGVLRFDLRDDPRQPRAGGLFNISLQSGFQPVSTWDFIRAVGEVRGYAPLPFGMVLAGKFRVGVMGILGVNNSTIPPDNIYQQQRIGPPALQLIGGGASSHRGFLPGLLGDAEQVSVSLARTEDELARGLPVRSRPVRINGGNTLWEASVELRIPLTTSLGLVAFVAAGDVNRWADGVSIAAPRFNHPQMAFGGGIRYFTIIGPLRLDLGVRPDGLQVFGEDGRPPPCTPTRGDNCRPVSRVTFFRGFPGALHLTIGEAF
ncbi:MAG: autotransporter assembly complex family protein [Sandaracinaceae bacterium]